MHKAGPLKIVSSTPEAADQRGTSIPFRGGGFQPQRRQWISWATGAVVVSAWALASSSGFISSLVLPHPMDVLRTLWGLLVQGRLLEDIGVSLVRILSGWAIGTLSGLFVGLLMGVSTVGRSINAPIIAALFPIPKIALLPVFILWFGIGEPSKIATIALGVFFPTAINTFSGIDNVARNLIRMGLSFNLPTLSIVFKILLPGALPSIIAGFRISSSLALVLLIAAEMIGAERGLGAFILQSGNLMQTDQLLAGVVVLSILGLFISAFLTRMEKRLLNWR